MEIIQKYRMGGSEETTAFKSTFNRPTGEAWRKYERLWTAYINDLLDNRTGVEWPEFDTVEEELEYDRKQQELEKISPFCFESVIKRSELQNFFGGLIRDWDYLLKFLETVSKADFKHPDETAFVYEVINEDTVILKLGKAGFSW